MEMERQIQILNIDDILPNRFQPRIKFNEQAINELAESIKLHGVIQPIVVRKISDKYEIIAGERRYKASILAGKKTIPAIVTSLDDKNSAEVALIENVQRQDLTPIEEAISYKKILDMGYISQEALGEKLGKKQSTIANKLRLLNLNDEVQEALMENKISERHARSLLKLNDDQQILMLNRIINERLTVRKTDEEIEKMLKNGETDDSNNQKELKGENLMNNDVLKEFNIPTEPIVENNNDSIIFEDEDIQSQTNTNNITNTQETTNMAPGFMDIDKIEKEAVDIVKNTPQPADINQLLKSEEQPVDIMNKVQQPLPVEEDSVSAPMSGGKFFNMFNFDESEKDEQYVSDLEEKQANVDFNEPISNASPFGNISNFGEPISTTSSNEIKPLENYPQQPVENLDDSVSMNSIENDLYPTPKPITNNSDYFNNQGLNNQSNISESVNFENPFNSSLKEQESLNENDNLVNFTQPVNHFNLTDDVEFANPSSGESISNNYVMSSNVKLDEDGEIKVELPQNNQKFVTADMKTVINTIRDCAATIEKYGFKIETEEIDLENSYEVTFKIDKNV